jgi:hypothetical protein
MLDFNSSRDNSKKFEITLVVRDKNGNPTGQTKTVETETASDLSQAYHNNNSKKRRRRRRKKRQTKP